MNDNNETISFDKCIVFLNSIGIQTIRRKIGTDSFLPGFLIENGIIVIDTGALQHPGDILHEAGHIAVVPAKDRAGLTEASMIKRKDREAEEMMAIAWSYAACIHLEIDSYYVFHAQGYRGGSAYITDSCKNKNYLGLLMLQGIGLTADETNAQKMNISSYPSMIRWLRA